MNPIRVLVIFCICLTSPTVFALPTLGDITGDPSLSHYTDTGQRSVRFDTTIEATAFLMFEFAGFKDRTSFGIYQFGYTDGDGHAILGDTMELFSGDDAPNTSATIRYDKSTGMITNASNGDSMRTWGGRFGLYIQNNTDAGGFTWYTNPTLNCIYVGTEIKPDCRTPMSSFSDVFSRDELRFEDHALIFDTSDNRHGSLLGSDIIVAFEDLCFSGCGNDADFNDLVVGINGVILSEPDPLVSLATGLVFMGWIRRRKICNKRLTP